jgi:hypothetical protein
VGERERCLVWRHRRNQPIAPDPISRSVKLEKRDKNYFASSRPRGKQRCRRTLKTHRKDVAERKIVAKRKAFEKGEWSPWDSATR